MPQSAERFRSLSKSKGRTVWFVLLRLSKNFVFRTVSRSKPRFRAKPKKNRALRAHFFFPCINSEIHKVNCRIAAREGGLDHAPGIYEFAKQIRLNACYRTKHKNRILLFRQAVRHTERCASPPVVRKYVVTSHNLSCPVLDIPTNFHQDIDNHLQGGYSYLITNTL